MKKYIERLSEDGLAIFLFHGVIEKSEYAVRNYTKKHLDKKFFFELMEGLHASGRAITIDEVVRHCRAGIPFPSCAYAITFDDGFENNYSVAAPILEKLKIPATFYITTDFVDRNQMSWIDRIEYCLEKVRSGTVRFKWSTGAQRFSTPQEKISICDDIRKHVKNDPTISQDELVREVFGQCGLAEILSSDDPLDRKMSWSQVQTLTQNPLFTVGGHSHRHSILSFLTPADLEEEVQTSINLLKTRGGITPIYYSYPEGLTHCYSDAVIAVLKKCEIVCCPTAEDGINTHETDLFHLKRTFVI